MNKQLLPLTEQSNDDLFFQRETIQFAITIYETNKSIPFKIITFNA